MRRVPARWSLAIVALSTAALAEERSVTVEVTACEGIDGAVVGRLVLLEIVGEPPAGIVVSLRCADRAVGIRIVRPSTGQGVERVLDAPPADDPDRSRKLAIAASQLFLSSAEALARPRAPDAPPPPRTWTFPRKRAANVATIAIRGGARVRALANPVVLPGVAVRGGLHVDDTWMPYLELGAETGDTARAGGRVDVSSASGAVGVARRLARLRGGGIDAFASLGVAYLRLSGAPAFRFRGGVTDGLRVEAAIGVAPALDFGGLGLALPFSLGATLPELEGEVPGHASVSTGGLWLALGLEIRIRSGS